MVLIPPDNHSHHAEKHPDQASSFSCAQVKSFHPQQCFCNTTICTSDEYKLAMRHACEIGNILRMSRCGLRKVDTRLRTGRTE
jgi:hypothetical protein